MDKAHQRLLARGYLLFLFCPVLDYDRLDAARLQVRHGEGRLIWLMPATLNTQGKISTQHSELRLLD